MKNVLEKIEYKVVFSRTKNVKEMLKSKWMFHY